MRLYEISNKVHLEFRVEHQNYHVIVTMLWQGQEIGEFQYDAESGRSLVELDASWRGRRLGQLLVLRTIEVVEDLGLEFVEDDDRTQDYDRVLNTLLDRGLAVRGQNDVWYVTDKGRRWLSSNIA